MSQMDTKCVHYSLLLYFTPFMSTFLVSNLLLDQLCALTDEETEYSNEPQQEDKLQFKVVSYLHVNVLLMRKYLLLISAP
jgi:hypothetical protein